MRFVIPVYIEPGSTEAELIAEATYMESGQDKWYSIHRCRLDMDDDLRVEISDGFSLTLPVGEPVEISPILAPNADYEIPSPALYEELSDYLLEAKGLIFQDDLNFE